MEKPTAERSCLPYEKLLAGEGARATPTRRLLQCRLSELDRAIGVGGTARSVAILSIDRPRGQGAEVYIGSAAGCKLVIDNNAASSSEFVRRGDATRSRTAVRTIRGGGKSCSRDRRALNEAVIAATDSEE